MCVQHLAASPIFEFILTEQALSVRSTKSNVRESQVNTSARDVQDTVLSVRAIAICRES